MSIADSKLAIIIPTEPEAAGYSVSYFPYLWPVYGDPCAPRDCVAALQRFQGGVLGKSQTGF